MSKDEKKANGPQTIADLTADPMNARKHNPRNIGMIVDSLQELGAARSIVIDEDGVVLAGNGVVEAAVEAGITKLKVIDAEGDELVAVRRTGLTPEQKVDLALRDNRAAELSEWEPEVLKALDSKMDISHLFTNAEKDRLFGDEDKGDGTVEKIEIKRAHEVIWMLLAIPVGEWPKYQNEVEKLQLVSRTTAQIIRPAKAEKVEEK